MNTSTALLILGMHRSGTSAASRVVNLLGAELGKNLMPAASDNSRGFWEQADIVPAHEKLLLALGRGWDSPLSLPSGWEKNAAADDFIKEVEQVLQREFADAALWAVKDPRLSLTLPLWLPLLQRLRITAKVLLVLRHPLEVAASLQKRDGFSREKSLLLWLHYTLTAEHDSRGLPRAVINYDSLLNDWQEVMQQAATHLQLQWPDMEIAAGEIDEFLSAGLRHNRVDDSSASAASHKSADRIEKLALKLYQLLQPDGVDTDIDITGCDDIRTGFADILTPLSPLLTDYEHEKAMRLQQINELTCKLRDSEHALHDRERQMEELRTILEQERHDCEQKISELKQVIANIYASTSWKITAPLRRLNQLRGSAGKNKCADECTDESEAS